MDTRTHAILRRPLHPARAILRRPLGSASEIRPHPPRRLLSSSPTRVASPFFNCFSLFSQLQSSPPPLIPPGNPSHDERPRRRFSGDELLQGRFFFFVFVLAPVDVGLVVEFVCDLTAPTHLWRSWLRCNCSSY